MRVPFFPFLSILAALIFWTCQISDEGSSDLREYTINLPNDSLVGDTLIVELWDLDGNPVAVLFAAELTDKSNLTKLEGKDLGENFYLTLKVKEGGQTRLYRAIAFTKGKSPEVSETLPPVLTPSDTGIKPPDSVKVDPPGIWKPIFSVLDTSIDENQALVLLLAAEDTSGKQVSASVDSLPEGATFYSAPIGTLSWIPGYDQAGSHKILVSFTNGDSTYNTFFRILVRNVNRPPRIASIPAIKVKGGETITQVVNATDPDGDLVQLKMLKGPAGSVFADSLFTWTPGLQTKGLFELVIEASDGVAQDVDTVQITVGAVNSPPELQTIADTTVNEDDLVSFTVVATDADNTPPKVTLTTSSLPTHATFSTTGLPAGEGQFSWKVGFDQGRTAPYELVFHAKDDSGATVSATVKITVLNVNRPPELKAIGNQKTQENKALQFTLSATDPDGDTVSFSMEEAPSGAKLTGSLFSWTPTGNQTGNHTVKFIAKDASSSASETITISVGAVNQPPTLQVVKDTTVNENATLVFAVTALDGDGRIDSLMALKLPTGAVFTPDAGQAGKGTFSWKPTYDQGSATAYKVEFKAVDDSGAQALATTLITVKQVNRAPAMTAIGNKTIGEGAKLSFTVVVTDPDEDAVQVTHSALPSGASFDVASLLFSWTPSNSQAGNYGVTFRVSDGSLSDSQVVAITVNNINLSPAAKSKNDTATAFEMPILVRIGGTDPDGSVAGYEVNTLVGGTLSTTSGTIPSPTGIVELTYTPAAGFSGAGSFRYRIMDNDGAFSAWVVYSVTVGKNQRPVISSVPPSSVGLGNIYTAKIAATDAEGHAITYKMLGTPPFGMAIHSTSGDIQWLAPWTGKSVGEEYTGIKVEASDGKGGKDTLSWSIAVAAHVWQKAPWAFSVSAEDQISAYDCSTLVWIDGNEINVSRNYGKTKASTAFPVANFTPNMITTRGNYTLVASNSNDYSDYTNATSLFQSLHFSSGNTVEKYSQMIEKLALSPNGKFSSLYIGRNDNYFIVNQLDDVLADEGAQMSNDYLSLHGISPQGDIYYKSYKEQNYTNHFIRNNGTAVNTYNGSQNIHVPLLSDDTLIVDETESAGWYARWTNWNQGDMPQASPGLKVPQSPKDLKMINGRVGFVIGSDDKLYLTTNSWSSSGQAQTVPGSPSISFFFFSGDGQGVFLYDAAGNIYY